MFGELKELKYFKEITDFKNLIMQNTEKSKTFEESSKSRGVFRTQVSIYDGVSLWIYLTAYYFRNKSSIIADSICFKCSCKWTKS